MDKPKMPLTIDQNKCPPCPALVCIGVCPQGILEPNQKGKPQLTDPTACTLCGVCANLCYHKAITLTKPDQAKT